MSGSPERPTALLNNGLHERLISQPSQILRAAPWEIDQAANFPQHEEIDYILKVRVANAQAYDAFYQSLISEVKVFNVTALLSMEELKSTTDLPI